MLMFYILKNNGLGTKEWGREGSRQQLRFEAKAFLGVQDEASLMCGPGHPSCSGTRHSPSSVHGPCSVHSPHGSLFSIWQPIPLDNLQVVLCADRLVAPLSLLRWNLSRG